MCYLNNTYKYIYWSYIPFIGTQTGVIVVSNIYVQTQYSATARYGMYNVLSALSEHGSRYTVLRSGATDTIWLEHARELASPTYRWLCRPSLKRDSLTRD
jgi:hypothetical protein